MSHYRCCLAVACVTYCDQYPTLFFCKMEAKLAREKAAIKSGCLFDYFKPKCSHPTSSSGDGVANVSDVAVVSNFYYAQSPVSEDVNLGSSGDGVANGSHVGCS